jgi:hypothetical protein
MEITLAHRIDLNSAEGEQLLEQVAEYIGNASIRVQADFIEDLFSRLRFTSEERVESIKDRISSEAQTVIDAFSSNH